MVSNLAVGQVGMAANEYIDVCFDIDKLLLYDILDQIIVADFRRWSHRHCGQNILREVANNPE